MDTVLHDPIVKPLDRTHGVFLDGILKVRSNKTGAGQYATGMRKGLRDCEEAVRGRITVKPISGDIAGDLQAHGARVPSKPQGGQGMTYEDEHYVAVAENPGYAALIQRLKAECDRYGLPFGSSATDALEGLLRHIYTHREAAKDMAAWNIKALKAKQADIWEEGREHGKHTEHCGMATYCNPYTKEN